MTARLHQNHPNLATAVRNCEWLATEYLDKATCTACHSAGGVQRFKTIEAAPEYLRVSLKLSSYDAEGNQLFADNGKDKDRGMKNKHPIIILNQLNLTSRMHHTPAEPLRYKLNGKIMHSGDHTTYGQYIVIVTSCLITDFPDTNPRFYINDTVKLARYTGASTH
jgi:hypothetical protein